MKVLIADPIAQEGIEALRAHAEVDVRLKMGPDELIAAIGEYDAIVVRSETKVPAEAIEAGRKLQVIGRAGVGVDNIDVKAATSKGIVVVNAPTGNTISAAEHTIAMMLALARQAGEWRRQDFLGCELRNKTLGIVGLGNVGSEVARRAGGLQMRLLGYDPFVSIEYARNIGVDLVSFEDLLRESDFISLHTPLTGSTKGLIGAKELKMVKPTVRIINCARGGIVDEKALYDAVEGGTVAGAAVDVFTEEPAKDSILFKSDKIIVTPHLAASTAEAQTGAAMDVAEQVIAVLHGEPARYTVNTPLISPETLAVVGPFLAVAQQISRLLYQLGEGQMNIISIKYEGEIANHDTAALKAALLGGLLENISDERINIVNANIIAQQRGLKVTEHKDSNCENYGNLITLEVTTSTGIITVAGTLMRGEPHIVRVNSYWIDVVPRGGYFLFSDHRDLPGLIGAVGTILGNSDINISSMQLGRLEPRGRALLVLELDQPVDEEILLKLQALPEIYSMKLVKL